MEEESQPASQNGALPPVSASSPSQILFPMAQPSVQINSASSIDSIEEFLLQSFEEQGFNDAIVNSERKYMDDNKQRIKQTLNLLIDKVQRIYKQKLDGIELQVKQLEEFGYSHAMDKCEAEKARVTQITEELVALKTENAEGRGKSALPLISYERGFARGVASKGI